MLGLALPRLSARLFPRIPALPAGRAPADTARAGTLAAGPGWRRRAGLIQGRPIEVELWSESTAQGESAIDAAMAEMHRIQALLDPNNVDSELSRINRGAGSGAVALSGEMAALLARALDFARLSDGAFDTRSAAVGCLHHDGRDTGADRATPARALAAVGWQKLELDERAGTVRFAVPGMRVDLDGFATGHAVDSAAAVLMRMGIGHASVSAGGDTRVVGDRRGRPWAIGSGDPRRSARVVAMLPLEDVSVSTAGDPGCATAVRGERSHRLIDPATGRSPTGVHSVTVLGGSALVAAALAKAVFVQGAMKGLALIEAQRDVDAVVVDAAGTLHHSSGLFAPASRPNR